MVIIIIKKIIIINIKLFTIKLYIYPYNKNFIFQNTLIFLKILKYQNIFIKIIFHIYSQYA